MKYMRFVVFALSALVAPLMAFGAATYEAEQSPHASHQGQAPQGLVEEVRRVTEPFHDGQAAKDAGYGEFLGCVSGSQEGAMGIHYVNGGFVADNEIVLDQPEALIYEPRDGQLRLVGVEYIVDVEGWFSNPLHTKPPVLEGQVFQFNDSPNRYGLN